MIDTQHPKPRKEFIITFYFMDTDEYISVPVSEFCIEDAMTTGNYLADRISDECVLVNVEPLKY